MHHCLQIAEIQELIVEFLVLKADQVAVALTCSSLREPALDSLWKQQDSLLPLLSTLPRNLWVKNHWNQTPGVHRYVRTPGFYFCIIVQLLDPTDV